MDEKEKRKIIEEEKLYFEEGEPTKKKKSKTALIVLVFIMFIVVTCVTSYYVMSYIMLKKLNLNVDIKELSYAEGCSDCVGGYKGRIAIHEVLVMTQEIRDAIANGMSKENLRKLVYKKEGTTTLLQDGLEKVLQGIII